MLLEKHSHECCIPLTKLAGSLQTRDQNIVLITRWNGTESGGEARLWGAACGRASAAMPCAPGRPLRIPNSSSGWECQSCSSCPHAPLCQFPLEHCCPKVFCLQRGLCEQLVSPQGGRRGGWRGWGGAGTLSLSTRGTAACFGWGGTYRGSSHSATDERSQVTEWKPQRNFPGGQISP